MEDDIIVTWEVEDGYVGASAPHTTTIPRQEYDCCETDEERQSLIDEYVEDDFRQTITYVISNVSDDGDPKPESEVSNG